MEELYNLTEICNIYFADVIHNNYYIKVADDLNPIMETSDS